MSIINGAKKIKKNEADKSGALKKKAMVAAATGAANFGLHTFESQTGIRFDPAPAYLFYVEITGIVVGLFTECSGIGAFREQETFREGGINDKAHSLPGRVHHQNITLKRGVSMSRELWRWFRNGYYDFQVKKANLSIIQGASGQDLIAAVMSKGKYGTVKRWNVDNAYPVKWQMSDLNVNSTDSVAIETLVLAHDGLSLSNIQGTPMSITGALT